MHVLQALLQKQLSIYFICGYFERWYNVRGYAFQNNAWFLFAITAAGVVPCGGPKKSPRTSSIVQVIFPFGPLRSARIF